jgi:hypothetical protein
MALTDTSIIDERFAHLRAHRNNIYRYRRLLATKLTDLERDYVERRLSEELRAMDELSVQTFPVALRGSRGLPQIEA